MTSRGNTGAGDVIYGDEV